MTTRGTTPRRGLRAAAPAAITVALLALALAGIARVTQWTFTPLVTGLATAAAAGGAEDADAQRCRHEVTSTVGPVVRHPEPPRAPSP